ncbi:hypothetical protein [Planctobacterium marinum]|uniref:Uncharacterized protein n=1 Tax=Planctobacterium marinum TaxID=1631968 RepID=A0AA48KSL4_9ALTE|nr:hypothetical protein MACH26_21250 [Planctobacterium marinum]
MNYRKIVKTNLLLLLFASTQADAIICLANNTQPSPKELYLANNCHYFSGSKELRMDRSGALFNYNNRGDYLDQLSGSSYIYCPILDDKNFDGYLSAEIQVSDLNQQQDVICQLGKSSYTEKGFAAYWGETASSNRVGAQTLKTKSLAATRSKSMPNSFITCSLPPQNDADQKASSLMAYTVSKMDNVAMAIRGN